MFHRKTDKPRVIRIPDKPTLFDLNSIGRGRDKKQGYDESKNGLLVLDECGDWFNSRNWQDKSRADVNTWFRHARKLGWDVYLIVQDISIIDSQARDSLAASIARCKRMDKVAIPFITSLSKWVFGHPIRPAKFHMARVEDADGVFLDRWVYKGTDLYKSYDTEQIFNGDYPHGPHSLLTPWHIYGRYAVPMNQENVMRITKIYWKRFSRVAVALISVIATVFMMAIMMHQALASKEKEIAVLEKKLSPVQKKELAESKPDKNPVSFDDRFKGWRYDGSMQVNNSVKYFFIDNSGIRYTSASMKLRSLRFVEHGYCLVEVISQQDSVMLQCPKELVSNDA
jgi:hypothetical protein